MFLIILTYHGLEKTDEHLAEHRAFLDKYYALGKLVCSGGQIPRTGGVIISKADSKTEVEHIISEDPFHIHEAASYQIIEFTPTKFATGFEPFI